MDIEELKGNSNKEREERALRKERDTEGIEIRPKAESASSKFFHTFFEEDLPDIFGTVMHDYVVPGIKESVYTFIGMCIGIDSRPRGGDRYSSSARSHNSYDKYYDRDRRRDNDRRREEAERPKVDFQHFFIPATRSEIEDIRNDLLYEANKYEVLSISNFYDILSDNNINVSSRDREYTDNLYGWFDIGPCRVDPVRGGYELRLPRPVSIKEKD